MTKANRFSQEEIVDFIQNLSDNERLMVFQEVCDAREQGKKDALENELNYYKEHYNAIRIAFKKESKDKIRKQYLQFELFITGGTIERLEQRIKEMKK
jgi:hypothetical protein